MRIRQIPTVVLTGGPCGGKSLTVEAIRTALAGKVVVVPEMATTILASFPLPGRDLEWSQDWQDSLQRSILRSQLEAEAAWEMAACHQGAKVILCDRGILDGAAYRNESAEKFCRHFHLEVEEVHQRYAGVVHLQTLAEYSPESYSANKLSNPHRFEEFDRAQALDRALLLAWQAHPAHKFIPAGDSIGRKIDGVIEFVRGLL